MAIRKEEKKKIYIYILLLNEILGKNIYFERYNIYLNPCENT